MSCECSLLATEKGFEHQEDQEHQPTLYCYNVHSICKLTMFTRPDYIQTISNTLFSSREVITYLKIVLTQNSMRFWKQLTEFFFFL